MNTLLRVLVAVGVAAALGAAYLYLQESSPTIPAERRMPASVPAAPVEGAETTGPRYPIPVPAPDPGSTPGEAPPPQTDVVTEPPAEPLPPLNDSTREITDVLSGMFTAATLDALFNTQEFVRRFVVTVDNLPNAKLPRQHLLFKRVPGAFQVEDAGEARVIAAANAARYTPYVQLAQRLETRRLVHVYVRFYPLFQEAYAELGDPQAYFNDRLVAVIDHLLETPDVDEPLPVVQPKVFYQYADAELEGLSAGQKAMLRMGGANAAQVKSKLRELRSALAGMDAPPASSGRAD